MNISKEEFDQFKDEHISTRLFKFLICNKPNSPNGYLATYRYLEHLHNGIILSRFQMMDHTGIAQIMYEPPKSDGSTCTLMAASLRLGFKKCFKEQDLCLICQQKDKKNRQKFRKALSLPFSAAVGVHFDEMTREEFRETINLNWNWLDGTSLL